MAEILATSEPNQAEKPRFQVKINEDDWSEDFVHGSTQQQGLNRMGQFTLDFDLATAGELDENGVVTGESRLSKLLTPHLEPFRDLVEIRIGYVASDEEDSQLELVMDGVVDNVYIDMTRSFITVRGRDRSAILQESFTHAQFRNQTVAGVVKEIAEKHELEVDIIDPGTELGTVFDAERIDFEHVPSHGYNDWELLTRFAEHDAYVVYVIGNTLHYLPIEEAKDTIIFEYGYNIDAIEMRKNLSTASSRVGIELASTQLLEKDSTLVTAGASRGPGTGRGDAAIYRFTNVPSTDPQVLGIIAESLAMMYAQFEHIVSVQSTGAQQQNLSNKMLVKGTGTVFDREYRIVSVEWSFGTEYGWKTIVGGLQLPDPDRLRIHRQRQSNTKA